MRTRTVAALVLVLAMGLAGCGRGGGKGPQVASAQNGAVKPSSSPTATASEDPDAPLKFARCMRQQGLTWFPDPQPGKGLTLSVPRGTDPKKVEAAQEKCKQYLPNGGEMRQPSAEDLEQARQMAKCMRENGVPNFPDPNPNGGITIDSRKLGTGPGDPTWDKAEKACAQYQPKGGKLDRHVEKGGSGGTTGGQMG